MRHYCTYFDRSYLRRGLALLESMRAHVSEPFRLHVLAMDEVVLHFLLERASDDLTVVPLTELRESDPDFTRVTDQRAGRERFFSVTAAFCLWLMRTIEENATLTYLDADTFFLADPSFLYDEIAEASIAITPHRFGPGNIHRKVYGIFNVGWVTWRKSPEGLRCLEDYRKECLEWCHDYVDGTRFADQRYLDTWPTRYAGVRLIDHPGLNLAPWNLDACPVSCDPPRIADKDIILYHFHGFRERPGGGFDANLEAYQEVSQAQPLGAVGPIYEAYYAQLCKLREVTGEASPAAPIPSHDEAAGKKLPRWEVVSDVMAEAGPDSWNVPSVVAELDRHLTENLRRVGTTQPLSTIASEELEVMTVASLLGQVTREQPRMLEWGGGLGLLAVQLGRVLGRTTIAHDVIELERVMERGIQHGLVRYVDSAQLEAARARGSARGQGLRYDLAVSLNAFHFAQDWQCVLEGLCHSAERVYLSRVPLVFSVPSFRFLHRFLDHPYRIVASAWAIRLSDLESCVTRQGFVLERLGPPLGVRVCQGAMEAPEVWSLTLRRAA
jgi:hypothetical protein